MAEHVHEWEYRYLANKHRCKICLEYMDVSEMEARLNAAERLTQFPRDQWDWVLEYLPDDDNPQYDALRECLDTLEGK